MNKRAAKRKIAIKRILPAAMAAVFLCCSGCAKPEESPSIDELPVSDTEHTDDTPFLPDTGFTIVTAVVDESQQVIIEPVPSAEIETPEPEQTPPTHKVNAQDVKLRKGSGTSHDIITKLDEDTKVTVYFSEKGWHKVKTAAGDVGYISAEYVSTTADGVSYGKVKEDDVKLRKGPGTSHDIITELDEGTELTIYSLDNGWYEVKTTAGKGYEGYISAKYVITKGDDDGDGSAATSEPTEKPKKTDSPKDDEKAESTPKPTEKPKKRVNTPYSKKYTKVKVNFVDSDPIKFETSTMSGDGVSQSMFAKNAITMVNIWTRT